MGVIFIYQIKCDNYVLYDPREEELILNNPKCKLQVNTVGEASFSIYSTHPHYRRLKKLRSVFEILQDGQTIFRGRMTADSKDFDNVKVVDLEGAMAYFNDSIIRPFTFPDDFVGDEDYNAAIESGNVVEYFLNWILDQHNSQVQDFQSFKLGKVTVVATDNLITRSSSDYSKTWETIKNVLFDSELGGFLCIRYEEDGNYIDYLEDFEQANVQRIEYGENLLDISSESDASNVYTAIIPLGAKNSEIGEGEGTEANTDDQTRLTIESLADGEVAEDVLKVGDTLYSQSAVDEHGWIYAPTKDTTWENVVDTAILQQKGIEYLTTKATNLSNTIEIKAVDLHFSDATIEAFRIYSYISVYSKPHEHEGKYKLTTLDIDILKPQNTKITLGDTTLSMTDINAGTKKDIVKMNETIRGQSTASPGTVPATFARMLSAGSLDVQKVLWDRSLAMNNNDVCTLSEKVSEQNSGIVLVFCDVASGTVFKSQFVAKKFVEINPGACSTFFMTDGEFNTVSTKRLCITDNTISGDVENGSNGTKNGITYNNTGFVLQYVIGV